MKVPETHSGQEAVAMEGLEDIVLDKILLENLLNQLTLKERETISLWAHRYTYKEIALYLTMKYKEKSGSGVISPSAVGTRIKKILEKLQKLAKVR
jgi:hypothetical protein